MMKTIAKLGTLLVALTLANPVMARTLNVNCHKRNQTITKALEKAKPGDTIRIRGTCREGVIITIDRLTLEGHNAVIDGENVDLAGASGLLVIDGVQGVVIAGNLIVQNSAAIGMIVTNNAQAFFRGDRFVSQNNASHGILAFSSASIRIEAGDIRSRDNGGDGVVVAHGSSAYLNIGPSTAFTVNSRRNRHGIQLANGGSLQMLGGTLNASQNRVHGLRAAYGANLFITSFGKVNLIGNHSQGLNIESNAQALVSKSPRIEDKTVTIKNNATAGVSVQAGFIDLREAEIIGNGPRDDGLDVDLGFGARGHLTGNTIDILQCDETVLLSPDTDVDCPTP